MIELYEVGGCVRDALLGIPSKDIDFTVVASGGWEEMQKFLGKQGFTIWLEQPEYLTIRAKFPDDFKLASGTDTKGLTADFVLARKENQYTDGRRPDLVTPGTLEDYLHRRDFTVNALAKSEDGKIIDLFGGVRDLGNGLLRCVGSPEERFQEDSLRALRAIRFVITKDMTMSPSIIDALGSNWLPPLLASVSVERRREELLRAFRHDTPRTMKLLCQFDKIMQATFADGLSLAPTLEKVKR